LILSQAVAAAMAAAPAKPPARPSIEPTAAQLTPVDPTWRAQGWRAVAPHAFVLKKLLPIRNEPNSASPPAFWLKGGTRVPVLVQGKEWWKISWTEGRIGWAPAADLEAHASFVLLDAKTGKLIRRMAAKGQWGAVSDGTSLWSIANTGITRTLLGDRPVFWAKPVAANRDALFPEWSVWNAERSAFVVRSRGSDQGAVLHTDVATGAVRELGLTATGELEGVTPGERLVVVRDKKGGRETQLYDPGLKRVTRRVPATAAVVSRAGISFLHRKAELIRCGTDLRATARARVGGEIHGVCLSSDERHVAAGFNSSSFGSEHITYVRLFDATTLKPAVTLTLEGEDATYPRAIGSWSGGWWLLASGEGSDAFLRFGRNGKLIKTYDSWGEGVVSPDGRMVYLANDEYVAAIDTGTGKLRRFPFSWRKKLPSEFLPAALGSDAATRLRVSSLTVSPDGKLLILTEWLSGDPEA
jgi:hypothetical protein